MKKLFLLLVILASIGISAKAQITPINEATYKTNGFTYAKEFWMCSSYTKNINMSIEAFGVAVSNQGKWFELKPDTYKDATTNYTSALLSPLPVDNIFNVDGRGPGVYEFLYINEAAGFCDMAVNAKSIFRIYVVPDLTGFSLKTVICGAPGISVDISSGIPTDVKEFATKMGWTFIFKNGATTLASPTVIADAAGLTNYTYEISDAAGSFAGKYAALAATAYGCATTAKISHSVEISTGAITPPVAKTLTYCLSNLVLQHPTDYVIDLNSVLNFTAPNGTWSKVSDGGTSTITAAGVATITLAGRTAPSTAIYKYEFDDCDNPVTKGSTTITLVFGTSTELTPVIDNKPATICRNLATGEVSLLDLLGISVPSTAGSWIKNTSPANDFSTYEIVTNGKVDLSDLQTGGPYGYKYNVSPAAVGDLCQITKYEATLNLTIDDVNGLNSGAGQICKSVFDGGASTINLTSYIAGLPATATWTTWDGTAIATPTAFPINSTNFKVGTNLFKFTYTSECGKAEGNLYITVTDKLTNFTDKTVMYCYLDAGAKDINLFSILGIAGLTQDWTIVSGGVAAANFNATTGVFKGSAEYGNGNAGAKTYVFKYTANGDGCIENGKEATITVVITPDIVAP